MEERMKRIVCGDLVPGCDFTAQAQSNAEVLQMELDHAPNVHNLTPTPQFLQRAFDSIEAVEIEPATPLRRQAGRRGSG
jgi:predicted small metal-binding protein